MRRGNSTWLDRPLRRRRMRGIDKSQDRSARAKLNLISVEQLYCLSNSLTIDERAVKAFQIDDCKLTINFANLRMAARNDRGGGIDHYVTLRIATQLKDILA